VPAIFISYRRNDSAETTNRIWSNLAGVWGEEKVIKDTDSFVAGPDFRSQMSRYIQQSDVILVIIGQNWSAIDANTGLSRIFDETDPVRTEIEEAVAHKKLIIPVLLNAREMPEATDLPDSIKDLRYYNAFRIRDDSNFSRDMNKLNSYFVHPDLIAIMGKGALPSEMLLFEEPKGLPARITRGIRLLLCCSILVLYWLVIGYTTPSLFPPRILRISGSNYVLMRLLGSDAGIERFKVLIVVASLIIDWLIVGTIVSNLFHESLFAISDFNAALLFGSLLFLAAAVILSIGLLLRDNEYRNVINLRKTLLVVSTNALLAYASSFQFLGVSYLYFPVFISAISASLFVYTIIGIGFATYSDYLSGINRTLEKRKLQQERATLLSQEYFERRKAFRASTAHNPVTIQGSSAILVLNVLVIVLSLLAFAGAVAVIGALVRNGSIVR
jgi:hypothetical protein